MGPSSYNNSPCPAWLPQHRDPEGQTGLRLWAPLHNCPPRGLAPPALPGLPPFPLPGLFIGPGSGASRTRGARAQDCGSPGLPQGPRSLGSVRFQSSKAKGLSLRVISGGGEAQPRWGLGWDLTQGPGSLLQSMRKLGFLGISETQWGWALVQEVSGGTSPSSGRPGGQRPASGCHLPASPQSHLL